MLIKLLVFGLMAACTAVYILGERRGSSRMATLAMSVMAVYAIAWIGFLVYLWFNHINFPLNLEAMELTILQHLHRVMAGQPLYVEPSSDFVPLAYAPLYYYVSVPFAWLFGANLFTLRLVTILGTLGSGLLIFLVVKKQTQSYWWAIIALGLFTAAYRAMDTYLDNAHSDSWLLFTVLLACYLIDLNRSRGTNLLGVFLLVVSFWFKQHGALFAIGGVLYLTWRDGIRNSWMYWALAALLGPVLYAIAPSLLGSQFLYYTLTVPSHWSELNFSTIKRYIAYGVKSYFILAGVGVPVSFYLLIKKLNKVSVWYFMLPFAMLSGFLGALDPGSNNNVFINMGVWFILTGVLGLHWLTGQLSQVKRWGLQLIGIGIAFVLFSFNPASVLVSPAAPETYQNFVQYLHSLDGPVYAPWIGQLEDSYSFSPAVHWVPMEDLIRGTGIDENNHPLTRSLLDDVLHPDGNAYILMNYPLENDAMLSFLLTDYRLKEDLGNRFAALSTLPKRFNLEYPRYLYEYSPQ